jgi:ribosomal protein S18 acetylase RimI-like enzyme
MIEVIEFRKEFLSQAAALFCANFRALRQAVPVLPDSMEAESLVAGKLEKLMAASHGVAALEDGHLLGYLGWFLIPNFRDTGRKAALCPEWGHAALAGRKAAIYRALYRAASTQWAAAGCQTHALSLLANDTEAEKVWFWSGFGLLVVDAVRPLTGLGIEILLGLEIRKAALADVPELVELEAEHWCHYAQPPVFMASSAGGDAAEFTDLLQNPHNSVWLALDGGQLAGYIRFEGSSFGAADIVGAETTVAITGAYVRPAYRGHKAAVAMLDAALNDYAARGFERCSVDFESLNPEAATFWPRYFEPVCYSLMRVPEKI